MKKKRFKIIWFYPHLKFWMGGSKYLMSVSSAINDSKLAKVSILCNTSSRINLERFRNRSVFVNTTNFIDSNNLIYWILFPLFILLDLISYLVKSKDADIFMASLFPSNFLALVISKIYNKPYYYFCYEPFPFFHDSDFLKKQNPMKRLFMFILSKLYGWIDILATQYATKVLTFNKTKRELINDIYGVQAKTVGMGVDLNVFRKTKYDSYCENKYIKNLKNKIMIFHSTDYLPTRNTDKVIKLLSKIIKYNKKIILLISSTNPKSPLRFNYVNLVKKLGIQKHVKFLGFVDEKCLPFLYTNSLCYLTLSDAKMHSSNMSIIEAMACGCIVIRAKLKIKKDYEFINNKSGFAVNPSSDKNIITIILKLIENKEYKEKISAEAKKHAQTHFSWRNVSNNILGEILGL